MDLRVVGGQPGHRRGANAWGLSTDQRGDPFAREYGAAPDMGAYEVNSLSLVVNTLADTNSGNYDPNDLSLREAVALANANPGPDTISFDPSLNGGTIDLTNGELAITDSVTIQGPGASNLTIDAQRQSRIFEVDDGDNNTNINVEIDGLTLTGGNVAGSNVGGGILMPVPGNAGGAILSYENLIVRDSAITGNTTFGYGGGIFAETFGGGTMTIENSTVSGNSAGWCGGGVYAESYYGGTATIRNSTISGNTSDGAGAGVFANSQSGGTVAIQNSTISGNISGWQGGGIFVESNANATATIQDSTISGNVAFTGGGIFAATWSVINIQDSTVSQNHARGVPVSIDVGTTSDGGGIALQIFGGTTTIQNSTIFGNTADGNGGGVSVWTFSGDTGVTTVQNCTITGNVADSASNGSGAGGGIFAGMVSVESTIIAANADNSGIAPDFSGGIDITHSLVGDNTGSGLAEVPVGTTDPRGNSNLIGDPNGHGVIDPKLGPLADNDGPTETMALLARSPAIDTGANPAGLAYDQRGVRYPRLVGSHTDIGAYESEDTTPPVATLDPNSVVVTASAATFTVTYADPDDNVLRSSIHGSEIVVAYPDGLHQYASLVSVTPDADGSPLVATYQVNAVDGAWTVANSGVFSVMIASEQVSDTNNNYVAAGSLGTFEVEVWVPYIPTIDQTAISVKTANHDTTATVSFSLSARYRVVDWGQPTWQPTSCQVNVEVEEWTGIAPGGVTTISHTYDLGTLAPPFIASPPSATRILSAPCCSTLLRRRSTGWWSSRPTRRKTAL